MRQKTWTGRKEGWRQGIRGQGFQREEFAKMHKKKRDFKKKTRICALIEDIIL